MSWPSVRVNGRENKTRGRGGGWTHRESRPDSAFYLRQVPLAVKCPRPPQETARSLRAEETQADMLAPSMLSHFGFIVRDVTMNVNCGRG